MSEPYSIQQFRGGLAVVWTDSAGQRHRRRLSSTDRPSAEAEARRRWQAGYSGEWTVGRIVPAYIAARAKAEIASTDRQNDAWKAMSAFWNNVLPDLIDEPLARSYVAQRNRSISTVRFELNMLSVALRWAQKRKLIDAAPDVWRPAPPPHKQRHISRPEFRRLLEATVAPHAWLYMVLGVTTCARPTAILELQWSQVDFERGLIDLNPADRAQTKKRRPVVPIADVAMEPLLAAREAALSDYVIECAGKNIQSIKKAFSRASERSGVIATPYTLRHTGAVWRAEEGISMPELAQLLGHDDSRTTEQHYARFSPQFLRKAVNAIRW